MGTAVGGETALMDMALAARPTVMQRAPGRLGHGGYGWRHRRHVAASKKFVGEHWAARLATRSERRCSATVKPPPSLTQSGRKRGKWQG